MCRNIKILFNFDPPVTDEEIRAASLQFVRKISGFNYGVPANSSSVAQRKKTSKANEIAFNSAVEEIAAISTRLLASLETNSPSRTREQEAAKAKERNAQRFQGKTAE